MQLDEQFYSGSLFSLQDEQPPRKKPRPLRCGTHRQRRCDQPEDTGFLTSRTNSYTYRGQRRLDTGERLTVNDNS